jgi:hypothetical protein
MNPPERDRLLVEAMGDWIRRNRYSVWKTTVGAGKLPAFDSEELFLPLWTWAKDGDHSQDVDTFKGKVKGGWTWEEFISAQHIVYFWQAMKIELIGPQFAQRLAEFLETRIEKEDTL